MPPLTEEFIEGLKQDFQENPITVERTCCTANDGNKTSQENLWRNWQYSFDNSCMEWAVPMDFIGRLEMVVRNGNNDCPDYPVYVKGTPRQQMGILLAVWYMDPELLLKYYDLLHTCIQKARKEKRVDYHLNMICDNRKAIVSILQFADDHHLKSGEQETREMVVEEAQEEFPGRKYDQVVAYWWTYMPEEIIDTLRMRVAGFLFKAAFPHEGSTELYVPELEPDLEAFFQEMWKQCPDTTTEYAEDLRRSMVGRVLRKLPLASDERERLCICGQTLDEVLHTIDLAELSSDEKIILEGYRADFPSLSIDTSKKHRQLQGSDSKRSLVSEKDNRFEWDDSFCIVRLNGDEFCLRRFNKPTMAHRTIKYLTQEYLKKRTVVPFAELTDRIGSKATKIGDLFKGYKEAMVLVRYGEDDVDSIGFSF